MTRTWLAVWLVLAALWVCTAVCVACNEESPASITFDGRPELLER